LEKEKNEALNSRILSDMNAEYFSNVLRNDFEVYKLFYDVFVRAIVGMRHFDSVVLNWTTGQEENTLATCSDEAMALLGFENSYEVWQDVYEKSNGQIHPIPSIMNILKSGLQPKRPNILPRGMLMVLQLILMTKNGVQMAFKRYNELLHKVVMNRVKNQSFIEKYIQWKKNKESEKFRNQIERKEKLPDAKFLNFYDPENLNEESFIAEDKEKEKDDRQGIDMEDDKSNECEANVDEAEK